MVRRILRRLLIVGLRLGLRGRWRFLVLIIGVVVLLFAWIGWLLIMLMLRRRLAVRSNGDLILLSVNSLMILMVRWVICRFRGSDLVGGVLFVVVSWVVCGVRTCVGGYLLVMDRTVTIDILVMFGMIGLCSCVPTGDLCPECVTTASTSANVAISGSEVTFVTEDAYGDWSDRTDWPTAVAPAAETGSCSVAYCVGPPCDFRNAPDPPAAVAVSTL